MRRFGACPHMVVPIGLALLGLGTLADHLAAIRSNPFLSAVGYSGQGPEELPLREPQALLMDPRTRGVVVSGTPAEREYWSQQSLRAGKPVLSCGLPAHNYARLSLLLEEARQAEVELCMVPRALIPDEVYLARQGAVYLAFQGWVSQAALRGTREGLLAHWAAPCLQMLAGRYGQLDSVYARTRSLGLNRPEEDVANALLRFRNGVEGWVSFCGLGGQSGMELTEWGQEDEHHHCWEWAASGPALLTTVYQSFQAYLLGREALPAQMKVPAEGLRWAEWFQQSARLDREIFADEVVHG